MARVMTMAINVLVELLALDPEDLFFGACVVWVLELVVVVVVVAVVIVVVSMAVVVLSVVKDVLGVVETRTLGSAACQLRSGLYRFCSAWAALHTLGDKRANINTL
eukprot:m.77704 g.77704  ORF g.77704 m.77704 type:complete len:106 (-) comp8142_c0_seq5:1713-2030(-)